MQLVQESKSDPFKVPTNEGVTREIYIKLIIVSVICIIFMIGEVIGGLISSSIALMTDAAHMLSDLVGFSISFVAVWLSRRPATEKLSYGFHRAEVIGGCASIILIWGLTIWLIVEAGHRVVEPEVVDGEVMMITAAGGLLANIVMGKVLHHHGHGHDHDHGHGHSHGHSHSHGKHKHSHDEHDHDGHNHEGHNRDEHNHKGHKHDKDNLEMNNHEDHHEGHKHDGKDHEGHCHDEHNHDEHSHEEHNHESQDHDEHNHDEHNHDGQNHDGHNHGHNHHEHKYKHDNHNGHKHDEQDENKENQNGNNHEHNNGHRGHSHHQKKEQHEEEHNHHSSSEEEEEKENKDNCCITLSKKEDKSNKEIIELAPQKPFVSIDIAQPPPCNNKLEILDPSKTEIPVVCNHSPHHKKSVHKNHQFKLMRLFTCSKVCKTSAEDNTKYCCCPQSEKEIPLVEGSKPTSQREVAIVVTKNNKKDSHSHSHSHENYNIRAAVLHVLGDFLQSIAVLIASIVIYFKPEISILDPILTFIFSILVLSTTFPMMKEFIGILMEGRPKGVSANELKEQITKIDTVKEIHDFHVWALTSGKFALSAHIVAIDQNHALKEATILCRKHGIFHSTIQVEDWKMKDANDWIKCLHDLH